MRMLVHSLPYVLTYVALTGMDRIGNWLLGGLLGGLVILAGRRGRESPPSGSAARLLWLPWVVWGAARRIASGAWQMLRVLTGRDPWRHVGFVTRRDAAQTDEGLILLALIHSASPGSVVAEAERQTNTLVVNVIDAREPERQQAAIARFYERYQRRLVP